MKRTLTFLLIYVFTAAICGAQDYDLGSRQFQKGAELYNEGEYSQAIQYFDLAEKSFTGLKGTQDLRAYVYLWRGLSYLGLYEYRKAIDDFSVALKLAQKRKFFDVTVTAAVQLGNAYYAIDDLAPAREAFENALSLAQKYSQDIYLMAIYESLGNIDAYRANYSSAQERYKTALEYAEHFESVDNILSIKSALAGLEYAQGNSDKAIELYTHLLDQPGIEQSVRHIAILDQLGNVYATSGDLDNALKMYTSAGELALEKGDMIQIIRMYIHMGGIYHRQERYEDALASYVKALPLCDEYQRIGDKSVCLFNMGLAYDALAQTENAIKYMEQSVTLKEELRLSATGTDRLDYLASQIHVYQWLVLEYLHLGDVQKALTTLESSSAKYLNQQLSGLNEGLTYSGSSAAVKSLAEDQLILNYGTTSTPWFTLFTLDNQGVEGIFLPGEEAAPYLSSQSAVEFQNMRENHRGLRRDVKLSDLARVKEFSIFELIDYYRLLLTSRTNDSQLKLLGRYFYNVFISPVEDSLEGKTELIIVPDNVLAFLPFETFVMPDGRYLVEAYDISYVQSLAVSEIIRSRDYGSHEMDFLGIGVGQYSSFNQVEQTGDYAGLADIIWPDLRGSIEEVEMVSRYYEESVSITDGSITESEIKKLSSEGKLRNFRILHIAAHGMVLPETPALSSLVLTENPGAEDDGYLNTDEIAALDLQAEFVNLSACETGLGKIYGGEGVVGITQAFLIAGANSLSTSLWQVADESTNRFMQTFYDYVVNQGYSYKKAMAATKRTFLKSRDYSHPYYWAPFVFYGE